jgi:hypothetical protein
LLIQDGGAASVAWGKIVSGTLHEEEQRKAREALTSYCEMDSYAMYAIWRALQGIAAV